MKNKKAAAMIATEDKKAVEICGKTFTFCPAEWDRLSVAEARARYEYMQGWGDQNEEHMTFTQHDELLAFFELIGGYLKKRETAKETEKTSGSKLYSGDCSNCGNMAPGGKAWNLLRCKHCREYREKAAAEHASRGSL